MPKLHHRSDNSREHKIPNAGPQKNKDKLTHPPVLTKRELEVLTHIVAGDQYRQIAENLGVSGETIKMHAKNILRKFNAQRISECMPEVVEYVNSFSPNYENLDCFMLDCATWAYISDNFQVSRRIAEGSFLCLQDALADFEWSIRHRGKLRHLTINGGAPTEITQEDDIYTIKTKFQTHVKLGDTFKVTLNYTFEDCAVETGTHKVITLPTKRVALHAEFDQSSTPSRIWAVKGIPHLQNEPVKTGFKASSNEATLLLKNPKRGEVAGILWER
jgi:DNA-binding CsgD family transcriptional regulator